jgi:hypothetical protein
MDPYDEWPFRVAGDSAERWNRKKRAWVPVRGTLTGGYRLTTWKVGNRARRWLRDHTIIYICHHGSIPPGLEIDHINGIKDDNRIQNLRAVTHRENLGSARAMQGNWSGSRRKIPTEDYQMIASLPSDSHWEDMAQRYGCHKVALLGLRARLRAALGESGRK